MQEQDVSTESTLMGLSVWLVAGRQVSAGVLFGNWWFRAAAGGGLGVESAR